MDEQLMARQMPHDLDAEQSVLGSILIDSRCITDIIGVVQPEDFYLQQNREIFEVIYSMFNYNHPPLLERIRALRLSGKENN